MKSHELARVLLSLEDDDIQIGHTEMVSLSEWTSDEDEIEDEIKSIRKTVEGLVLVSDSYYGGKIVYDFTKDAP